MEDENKLPEDMATVKSKLENKEDIEADRKGGERLAEINRKLGPEGGAGGTSTGGGFGGGGTPPDENEKES